MKDRAEIEQILHRFKNEIGKVCGEKFIDLILFGSYARGDYSEDSDIDVLFLVKEKLSKSGKDKIAEVLTHFSLEYDVLISCIDYPYGLFKEYNTLFLLNVKEESVKI